MAKVYKSDLVGIQESVVDEMLLLNPHDIPLLSLLKFGEAVANVKHEWVEDEMFADESTVAGAKLATDTAIVVADAEPFAAGHVVKVAEELMKVTAVDAGTKTLTVVRGYAGTTAADIADKAKIEVMFVEGVEGADARAARYKQRVRKENITQIFDETIELSGTSMAMAQYGIDDLYEYERAKKLMELSHQLEKALINGIKYESGQVRQMGGIRQFISTNVDDASGAALSVEMFNNLAQSIYEKGGFKGGSEHVIVVPAKQKIAVSELQKEDITLERGDTIRGQVVDTIVTDFGRFPVLLNNNLDPSELMIIDLNRIAIRPLRGREFFHEVLGRKGDYLAGQLVGEYTLEFKQEKAHGRLKNLA